MTAAPAPAPAWVPVCRYADLLPERGVAALVRGEQVALFRTFDGAVHATANLDPFSGAFVLSRGIVGTHGGVPTITSPLYKQSFDLRSGRCTTDDDVSIPVHEVRRNGEVVEVQVRP